MASINFVQRVEEMEAEIKNPKEQYLSPIHSQLLKQIDKSRCVMAFGPTTRNPKS